MNRRQREQVRDNARYLQNVRPVDPTEIHEYVEGQPHPAAVTQVLREQAFELGFIERADGTFVPVPDGTLRVEFGGVQRFPDAHADRLLGLLTERYGPDWHEGRSGDAIRETIRRLKADYYHQHPVEYDEETALAYAVYHLPDYYAVAQHALAALVSDGLFTHRLRVLDVGAGVGGPALSVLDFLPDDCLLEYHAIEPSAAADVFTELVNPGRNQSVEVHRETAESFSLDHEYDLILFANVLSELDDPAAVVERSLNHLADRGTCLLLAPADRNTAIGLRDVERTLADEKGYTVYAPTVRLWPNRTPTDRGWSFDLQPDIAVPAFQRRLDESATDEEHTHGEFVNVDVQYAYSALRRDGLRRIEFTPDPTQFAPMADSETHVTDRIDLVGIKLSHDLGTDNPLFKVGDGSEHVDHYAVVTTETALNRDLTSAAYGALLAFENALVLWNDDERAYNLVVDEETVVDVVIA